MKPPYSMMSVGTSPSRPSPTSAYDADADDQREHEQEELGARGACAGRTC